MVTRWSRVGAWALGGLVAVACGLNPQPEPPAAADMGPPGDYSDSGVGPSGSGAAFNAAGGNQSSSTGGTGNLGTGATTAAGATTGTGGFPSTGGTLGTGGPPPMVSDGGCSLCGPDGAADAGTATDAGAEGDGASPADAAAD